MGAMNSSTEEIEAIQMDETFNPSGNIDAEARKLYNAIQNGQANPITNIVNSIKTNETQIKQTDFTRTKTRGWFEVEVNN